MNKVITVNLNGNAYQIDEDGYNGLRDYVHHAEAQLSNSADRREVIADLEQAIGEKCSALLRPHKTVITAAEIAQILTEVGPVQNVDGDAGRTDTQSPPRYGAAATPHRKRLYRIRRGSGWAGVCRGLAAYADTDVTLVRVIFVLGTLCSGGLGLLIYFLMILVVPIAYTDSELDEAHAAPPALRRS